MCMLFNIKTIEKFDFPTIPKNLLLSIDQVRELDPITLKRSDGSIYEVEWYKAYTANSELTNWVKENITIDVELVEYVITTKAVTMHVDLGRKQAFNYIINTGGDNVATEFYKEDRATLIDRTVCEPFVWYGLNVSIPHRVAEPQPGVRFLVSVTAKDAVTYYM